jgi:hypothetical protein
MGEEARTRDADLARIEEDRAGGSGGYLGDIDIGHDHDGRLAAEFERDALERSGRVAVDELADLGRAGEGDLVDIGMLDHTVAGRVSIAGDDVDDAGREACLRDQVGQAQRGERGLLGGLQHERAACRQGRRDLEAGHQQREVPRHDLRAHAYGLAERVAEYGAARHGVGGRRLAGHLGSPARHETDLAHCCGHVDGAGHALGLAVVDRLELRELVGMCFDQVGEAIHDPLALNRRQARPAAVVERRAGRGDSTVDVLFGRINDARDLLAARRILDPDRRVMRRFHPLVIDEKRRLAGQGLPGSRRVFALLIRNGGHLIHR